MRNATDNAGFRVTRPARRGRAALRRQSAFTLIEIIVTIIVIGISATALLSVFTNMIRGSADPLIQQQATSIAGEIIGEYHRDYPPRETQQGSSWRALKALLATEGLEAVSSPEPTNSPVTVSTHQFARSEPEDE